jgi:hypothetical protein
MAKPYFYDGFPVLPAPGFRAKTKKQVARVRGSGKKQLPRPNSYMPEEAEDYGADPRGALNPET